MNTANQTKKQHFIPQFYLRNFVNRQNLVEVLDLINNRMGTPRSCAGVAYEHYFYAAKTGVSDEISQQIEGWWQAYEDVISRDMPGIIKKILSLEQINHSDRYTLSALMCMLWLRTPRMREHLNQMNEEMTKKMMALTAEHRVENFFKELETTASEEEKKKLIDMMRSGEYKLTFNNAQHLLFMTKNFGFGSPGFTNMFYGHKWTIYIAKGKQRFITTDSPVVEWWPPPQGFYGPSFLERKKYFALTPEIFFELTYPIGSKKAKRKTIFESTDEIVSSFNILLTAHAHEFAYSSDKNLLEDIIRGRQNPGSLERKYYSQYELPWDIARREGRANVMDK